MCLPSTITGKDDAMNGHKPVDNIHVVLFIVRSLVNYCEQHWASHSVFYDTKIIFEVDGWIANI